MTAIERLLAALSAFAVNSNGANLQAEIGEVQDGLQAEQREIDDLREDVAALKGGMPATETLTALAVRVQALEDRNSQDDSESEIVFGDEAPLAPVLTAAQAKKAAKAAAAAAQKAPPEPEPVTDPPVVVPDPPAPDAPETPPAVPDPDAPAS